MSGFDDQLNIGVTIKATHLYLKIDSNFFLNVKKQNFNASARLFHEKIVFPLISLFINWCDVPVDGPYEHRREGG